MNKPRLRARIKMLPPLDSFDDCVYPQAVVERLHPSGERWLPVDPGEDPVRAHRLDQDAMKAAAAWADCPKGSGYATWDPSGPVWVSCFAEGNSTTPIPLQ